MNHYSALLTLPHCLRRFDGHTAAQTVCAVRREAPRASGTVCAAASSGQAVRIDADKIVSMPIQRATI